MASRFAVDTSVVVAILFGEPDADLMARRLLEAPESVIGAPTVLECAMVIAGKGKPDADQAILHFVRYFSLDVLAWTPEHAEVAIAAFLLYGKGRHRAALNFGDCQAYATAKLARLPLLYLGDDFAQTDIEAA
ncbi:MAG: type II toxin-antitoxin system VapC family toxin [Acidobacteria bacterium]|nr:type II toxin-antitoxin system VapC family toxin [Acidobacteriota bacterium]